MEERNEFNLTKDQMELENCKIDLSLIDVSLNPEPDNANVYRILVDKPY